MLGSSAAFRWGVGGFFCTAWVKPTTPQDTSQDPVGFFLPLVWQNPPGASSSLPFVAAGAGFFPPGLGKPPRLESNYSASQGHKKGVGEKPRPPPKSAPGVRVAPPRPSGRAAGETAPPRSRTSPAGGRGGAPAKRGRHALSVSAPLVYFQAGSVAPQPMPTCVKFAESSQFSAERHFTSPPF